MSCILNGWALIRGKADVLHGFLKSCAWIGTGDEWPLQKLGGFVGECGHAGGGCVVGLVRVAGDEEEVRGWVSSLGVR